MKRISARSRRGFTLIELVVVLLILAILAAMIVPRFISRTEDAKVAKAMSDIASLSSALDQFRIDTGRYPSTEEGLTALRSEPGDARGWKGPYIAKQVPPDPWGNEYLYEQPGADGEDSFFLISNGADGQPGGEGNDADIGSEE